MIDICIMTAYFEYSGDREGENQYYRTFYTVNSISFPHFRNELSLQSNIFTVVLKIRHEYSTRVI